MHLGKIAVPLLLSKPYHSWFVHYISSKCPICFQSPGPAPLQYIYTANIPPCASCSKSHSWNRNRHRLECGLVLLNSFKTSWVESKKKMHGRIIKMERTYASWKTQRERKNIQHERTHLIKKMFFSRPNNTRLLLTQAPGKWHSTLHSWPHYISPLAVNITSLYSSTKELQVV